MKNKFLKRAADFRAGSTFLWTEFHLFGEEILHHQEIFVTESSFRIGAQNIGSYYGARFFDYSRPH